jgi:glycosyltransferase involved in cell wall biosynthesis
MQILCVMRMPPDPDGHGGSQRAWALVEMLRHYGEVHFVLLYRDLDEDCVAATLAEVSAIAASVTRVDIAGWRGVDRRVFGVFHPGIVELLTMRSHEAPRLPARELHAIAEALPIRRPDLIFAGRLCCAVIIEALIELRLLPDVWRVVDFDDLMSNFKRTQIATAGASLGRQGRVLAAIDARVIARAEARMARRWHGVGLTAEADAVAVRDMARAAPVVWMPNIVERETLSPRVADGTFRVLFTGNLRFAANAEGLDVFITQAWPLLRRAVPGAALTIVGKGPPEALLARAAALGIALHADVPAVAPYYADCDVVIAPILFGSGTRIKILEAMAFGRAVVSTSAGAEGLAVRDGEHVLIADTMPDFAAALARLAGDPALRAALAREAGAYQRAHFGRPALQRGMSALLTASRERAMHG